MLRIKIVGRNIRDSLATEIKRVDGALVQLNMLVFADDHFGEESRVLIRIRQINEYQRRHEM